VNATGIGLDGEPPRLAAVELVRVRLPLRRVLRSGHGEESVRELVLVRAVDDDGNEGWGECSALEAATYTGEYTEGAWVVLRDVLVPALLARRDLVVRGHPFAKSAIVGAVTDLAWRRDPVREVLVAATDGAGRPWTAVLGIHESIDDLLTVAADAIDRGASALKLKVAVGHDLEPLRALVDAMAATPIAVDANQGYDGEEDRVVALGELLASTDAGRSRDERSHARAYVEQPLAADDLLGHAALAARLAVPIALDESIRAVGDADAAWALGSARLVNVKPARLEGSAWTGAGRTPSVLVSGNGPGRFLGGMLESGVGRAAALTTRLVDATAPTDLGPSSWYFEDDITDPIELGQDGRMRPPAGDGLVPAPRAERLAEAVVDRLLIRP
jgi:o-succinylbenzoate synthase